MELDSKVNVQISNGFIILTSTNDSNDINFNQIAKCINEKQKTIFKYEFLRRRDTSSSSNSNNSQSIVSYFSTRSGCLDNLNKIISIRISIIRTLNSTSPCLNSIKIYGYLINSSIESNELKNIEKNLATTNKVEIPDEFIDELTHEMMRLPVKLPSQKYIDKSTLDKYLLEKRQKFQPELDPFTNIEFSATHKPIIDEKLKSKIDKFLFDNQNSILIFKNTTLNNCKRKSMNQDDILTKQAILKKLKLDLIEEKKDQELSKIYKKCNCCLNLKTQFTNMYEITTCKHVYCSHCIKSIDRNCIICNKMFESNQIINLDRKNMATT